jgi:hypothetical protein
MLLLSSHREMPHWPPSKLPDTALSSAPTPGAPSTSLPAPSAAPLLHQRRSSPADQSHCGQPTSALLRPSQPHPKHRTAKYFLPNHSDPADDPYSSLPPSYPHRRSPPPQRSLPVSPSPLFGSQTCPSPHRLTLRPLHCRPLAEFHQQVVDADRGEGMPCFVSGRKAEMDWASPLWMGRAL